MRRRNKKDPEELKKINNKNDQNKKVKKKLTKKQFLMLASTLLIVLCFIGIYLDMLEQEAAAEKAFPDENIVFIDVVRDTSPGQSIVFTEAGESYLNGTPLHYRIYADGDVFECTAIESETAKPIFEYKKTLTRSELIRLEEELKELIQKKSVDENEHESGAEYWFINIKQAEESIRVNSRLYDEILDKYMIVNVTPTNTVQPMPPEELM